MHRKIQNSTPQSSPKEFEDLYHLNSICLSTSAFSRIFNFSQQIVGPETQELLKEYVKNRAQFGQKQETSSFLHEVFSNATIHLKLKKIIILYFFPQTGFAKLHRYDKVVLLGTGRIQLQ